MADKWEYDISKTNIPTFIISGTGYWDAGTATSKDQVNDEKNNIIQGNVHYGHYKKIMIYCQIQFIKLWQERKIRIMVLHIKNLMDI